MVSAPRQHRKWACAGCNTLHDRDENAAKNILAESERVAALSGEIMLSTAGVAEVGCGEGSAGRCRKAPVKLTSVKQQVKHNPAIWQSYA
jgi:transposase